MSEPSAALLEKLESGFAVALPADRSLDCDAWMAPIASDGIKSVDFLVRAPRDGLWFVEFKTSMPRPDGQARDPGALRRRCDEVVEKVTRTALALLGTAIGRTIHAAISHPAWLRADDRRGRWRVVLVVTRAERAWLEPVRNALREALRPLARTVGIELEPKVLDADLAERMGLGRRADRA